MAKPLTAPARLDLLLPWLNGDYDEHVWGPNPTFGHPVYGTGEAPEEVLIKTDFAAVRDALDAFIKSFDGSASAAHVVAEPDDAVEALDDQTIEYLEAGLRFLLNQGFGDSDAESEFPASSLRFAVRSAGRQNPKLGKFDVTKGGSPLRRGLVKRLRDYRAPGAYVLRVKGATIELVPFLLGHLLTAPDMVSVKRCKRVGCSHFIGTATAAVGAPKQFCSGACRELNKQLEQRNPRRVR